MKALPTIKKKVHSFLTKEDGKISKESLIKTGVLLGAAAMAGIKTVEAVVTHTSNYPAPYGLGHGNCVPHAIAGGDGYNRATPAHQNSYNPSQNHCLETHASHSVHSSHGSGGPCDW